MAAVAPGLHRVLQAAGFRAGPAPGAHGRTRPASNLQGTVAASGVSRVDLRAWAWPGLRRADRPSASGGADARPPPRAAARWLGQPLRAVSVSLTHSPEQARERGQEHCDKELSELGFDHAQRPRPVLTFARDPPLCAVAVARLLIAERANIRALGYLCCPSGNWLSAPRSSIMRTSVPESVAVRASGSQALNAVAESGW
jgi:hypothetical protein